MEKEVVEFVSNWGFLKISTLSLALWGKRLAVLEAMWQLIPKLLTAYGAQLAVSYSVPLWHQ